MRRSAVVLLCVVIAGAGCSSDPAPPAPAAAPSAAEAATEAMRPYLDAFEELRAHAEALGGTRVEGGRIVSAEHAPGGAERLRALLVRVQPVLERVMEAAAGPAGDWTEPEPVVWIMEGPALEELEAVAGRNVEKQGPIRHLARWLVADAARLLEAGDPAGTTDRLVAVVRLARHSADEPALIGRANPTYEVLAQGWAGAIAGLPEGERARLREELARLAPLDPKGLAAFGVEASERALRALEAELNVEHPRVVLGAIVRHRGIPAEQYRELEHDAREIAAMYEGPLGAETWRRAFVAQAVLAEPEVDPARVRTDVIERALGEAERLLGVLREAARAGDPEPGLIETLDAIERDRTQILRMVLDQAVLGLVALPATREIHERLLNAVGGDRGGR